MCGLILTTRTARTVGTERRADSPKPPEPMQFAGELPVKGDAHADAFDEGRDNVTVLTTENFVDVVMNPHMDVLVIVQAHDSSDSQEFYKSVHAFATMPLHACPDACVKWPVRADSMQHPIANT